VLIVNFTKTIYSLLSILLDNDYHLKFIFNIINSRIKYLISNYRHQTVNTNSCNDTVIRWFMISFVHSVSHKFIHFLKNLDFKLSYFNFNKFEFIIKAKGGITSLFCRKRILSICCPAGTAMHFMRNRLAGN